MPTRLIAFGEVLEDQYTDAYGKALHLIGGAPLNFLAMARRICPDCHLLTCLGKDQASETALRMIRRERIEEDMISFDPDSVLGYTSVTVDKSTGERNFTFHKEHASFLSIRPGDIRKKDFPAGSALYVGTTSLLNADVRKAMEKALSLASFVLFDPNRRPTLFARDEQRRLMLSILPKADILKIADDEIDDFLERKESISQTMLSLFPLYPRLKAIFLTKGRKGISLYLRDERRLTAPSIRIENIVDSVGCGDAAFGAFAGYLISKELLNHRLLLSDDQTLEKGLYLANVCGGLVLSQRGALPMPSRGKLHRALMKLKEE